MPIELLSDTDIQRQLTTLQGWERVGKEITKRYKFADFRAALAFVNQVADLAEAADHHPDIIIRYNRVTLTLSTHSAGGLTENDFQLAHQIDRLG
ncbi:MAG: 4a-hydroxytetrahydrobiopterin dehydratase [Elusimicrobia bacterium]|nr:4a-hydroxytetrahydrobiopterin dehydratase [Elusimicrobiota bacterium]